MQYTECMKELCESKRVLSLSPLKNNEAAPQQVAERERATLDVAESKSWGAQRRCRGRAASEGCKAIYAVDVWSLRLSLPCALLALRLLRGSELVLHSPVACRFCRLLLPGLLLSRLLLLLPGQLLRGLPRPRLRAPQGRLLRELLLEVLLLLLLLPRPWP